MHRIAFAALAGGAAMLCVAHAETVGNATGIIPYASQAMPGMRTDLRLRDNIIRYAELATAWRGALEVTFLDGSRLTMGQNSRVRVDEYVYRGPGSAGSQALRMSKGVFRFVSGSMPKDRVRVDTPAVTIGIRGTAFRAVVNEDGTGAVSVERGPGGEKYEVVLTDKKTGNTLVVGSGQMVTFGGPRGFGAIGGGEIVGCQ